MRRGALVGQGRRPGGDGTPVRAMTADQRLAALHCQWEDTPGASPSRLLLAGTTMRRNLQARPRTTGSASVASLRATSSGWGGTDLAIARVADSSAPSGGGYVTRLTRVSAGTTTSGDFTYSDGPGQVDVTPGKSYAMSIEVRSSAALVVCLRMLSLTSTGASAGYSDSPIVTLVGGADFVEISVVGIAPSGGVKLRPTIISRGVVSYPAGTTLDVDACLTEPADQIRPFFDGGTAGVDLMRLYETPPPASRAWLSRSPAPC